MAPSENKTKILFRCGFCRLVWLLGRRLVRESCRYIEVVFNKIVGSGLLNDSACANKLHTLPGSYITLQICLFKDIFGIFLTQGCSKLNMIFDILLLTKINYFLSFLPVKIMIIFPYLGRPTIVI